MTAATARKMCQLKLQEQTPKLLKPETRLFHDISKRNSISVSSLCTRQWEPKASGEYSWTDVTRTFT